MTFRDWSEDDYDSFYDDAFERIFNEIPGIADLSPGSLADAEALFAAGWLTWGEYDRSEVEAIRDEFYDLVGMYEDDFDWQEFRELYDAI